MTDQPGSAQSGWAQSGSAQSSSGQPGFRALIGSALLAAGRPLSARELAEVLDVPLNTAEREIRAFGAALDAAGLGFHLEAVAGGYRLVVPPEGAARLAPILAPPPLPALSGAAQLYRDGFAARTVVEGLVAAFGAALHAELGG